MSSSPRGEDWCPFRGYLIGTSCRVGRGDRIDSRSVMGRQMDSIQTLECCCTLMSRRPATLNAVCLASLLLKKVHTSLGLQGSKVGVRVAGIIALYAACQPTRAPAVGSHFTRRHDLAPAVTRQASNLDFSHNFILYLFQSYSLVQSFTEDTIHQRSPQ